MKYRSIQLPKQDSFTYEFNWKLSFAKLNDDSCIDLGFDIKHGIDEKKIFFSCSTNPKKYYLNDTIELFDTSYKIAGLVYNDSLRYLSVLGYPEKNLYLLETQNNITDTLSYRLYDKERQKFSTYMKSYRKKYWNFYHKNKEWLRHTPYPCYYFPPFYTNAFFSTNNHLSIILAK